MDELVGSSSLRTTEAVEEFRLPGEAGVWIFIFIDMCFFGLLFLSFVIDEAGDVSGFRKSQALLETNFGLFNTLILLTSSWLVALGVQAARRGAGALASKLLRGATLLGFAFLGIKAIEYTAKFNAGIYLTTNNFFMFYFFVTFLHGLHVFAGSIVLFIMSGKVGNPQTAQINIRWLESAGIFWHMVDLLWVMIFALFYLISWG